MAEHLSIEKHLAEATWLVNTQGSINQDGPAQSRSLHTVEGDKVPVVHVKSILGKAVWSFQLLERPDLCGTVFAQGSGCTCWVMQKNGNVQRVREFDRVQSVFPCRYIFECIFNAC